MKCRSDDEMVDVEGDGRASIFNAASMLEAVLIDRESDESTRKKEKQELIVKCLLRLFRLVRLGGVAIKTSL